MNLDHLKMAPKYWEVVKINSDAEFIKVTINIIHLTV